MLSKTLSKLLLMLIGWGKSILEIERRNGVVFLSQECQLVGRIDATLNRRMRVEFVDNVGRELHVGNGKLSSLVRDRLELDIAGPQIWCARNCELIRSVSEVETF